MVEAEAAVVVAVTLLGVCIFLALLGVQTCCWQGQQQSTQRLIQTVWIMSRSQVTTAVAAKAAAKAAAVAEAVAVTVSAASCTTLAHVHVSGDVTQCSTH
jgi:hypothetical protein